MAEHLVTILGDLLYTKTIKEDEKHLPSPMSLRRKILVKAKRIPPGDNATADDNEDYNEDDDDELDGLVMSTNSKRKKYKVDNRKRVTQLCSATLSFRKSLKSCRIL